MFSKLLNLFKPRKAPEFKEATAIDDFKVLGIVKYNGNHPSREGWEGIICKVDYNPSKDWNSVVVVWIKDSQGYEIDNTPLTKYSKQWAIKHIQVK